MAAGEFVTMLFFAPWLIEVTFHGVPFWSLLVYVYASLLVTKATAEAITSKGWHSKGARNVLEMSGKRATASLA